MTRPLFALAMFAACPAPGDPWSSDPLFETGALPVHADETVVDSSGPPSLEATPLEIDIQLRTCYEQITPFSYQRLRYFEDACWESWFWRFSIPNDWLWHRYYMLDRAGASITLHFFLEANPELQPFAYSVGPHERYMLGCFEPVHTTCPNDVLLVSPDR